MEAAGKLPRFSDHVSWRFAPLYVLAGQRSTDGAGEIPSYFVGIPPVYLSFIDFPTYTSFRFRHAMGTIFGSQGTIPRRWPEARRFFMESNMFCYQCQETPGCTRVGGYGKQPEVAALQDLLSTSPKGCPP